MGVWLGAESMGAVAMNSKTPAKVYVYLLAFSVFLFACTMGIGGVKPIFTSTEVAVFESTPEKVEPSQTPSIFDNGCIPPLEEGIVYSTDLNPSKPIPGQNLIVAPLPPWELVSALPERMTMGLRLFSCTSNGHIEIWVKNGKDWDKNPDGILRTFVFLIYTPDTGKWKEVSAMISGSNIAVGHLFTAKDGSLWDAIGDIGILPSSGAKSTLAKYNEQTEKFEFAMEASDIPATRIETGSGFSLWNKVLQDDMGVFWILVNNNGIYRFDPITNLSEKYADTPNTEWGDMAISSDGYIYYLDNGVYVPYGMDHINDLPLFRFDIKTRTVERVGISLGHWTSHFNGMLVDDMNRLWLGGAGFRDSSGNWFQIQKAPIFIVNSFQDRETDRWISPSILLQSSDGRYWFNSSYNGAAWLDLKKDKWCWFATYHSDIVEDSDHNLWMIADEKLYKLSLGKE